jgi:hypothetical protein
MPRSARRFSTSRKLRWKRKVQPHGVGDHLGREVVAAVERPQDSGYSHPRAPRLDKAPLSYTVGARIGAPGGGRARTRKGDTPVLSDDDCQRPMASLSNWCPRNERSSLGRPSTLHMRAAVTPSLWSTTAARQLVGRSRHEHDSLGAVPLGQLGQQLALSGCPPCISNGKELRPGISRARVPGRHLSCTGSSQEFAREAVSVGLRFPAPATYATYTNRTKQPSHHIAAVKGALNHAV